MGNFWRHAIPPTFPDFRVISWSRWRTKESPGTSVWLHGSLYPNFPWSSCVFTKVTCWIIQCTDIEACLLIKYLSMWGPYVHVSASRFWNANFQTWLQSCKSETDCALTLCQLRQRSNSRWWTHAGREFTCIRDIDCSVRKGERKRKIICGAST